MLAAFNWETVGAIAGAVTAVVGAIAAVGKYVGKLFARGSAPEDAGDAGDEARSRQPRASIYAFPLPDSAVEDVLEGIVDAVNLADYGFTLGQDYLSVGTPTAVAIERRREGSVRVAVDAAVLDSSLPIVSSLPGY